MMFYFPSVVKVTFVPECWQLREFIGPYTSNSSPSLLELFTERERGKGYQNPDRITLKPNQ
jgi:hypothetical protein